MDPRQFRQWSPPTRAGAKVSVGTIVSKALDNLRDVIKAKEGEVLAKPAPGMAVLSAKPKVSPVEVAPKPTTTALAVRQPSAVAPPVASPEQARNVSLAPTKPEAGPSVTGAEKPAVGGKEKEPVVGGGGKKEPVVGGGEKKGEFIPSGYATGAAVGRFIGAETGGSTTGGTAALTAGTGLAGQATLGRGAKVGGTSMEQAKTPTRAATVSRRQSPGRIGETPGRAAPSQSAMKSLCKLQEFLEGCFGVVGR